MGVKTERLRNVAIAGHGGTGKTTLTEMILFSGGVIKKPETVESGKTVSDYTAEEVSHGLSIHTSLSNIMWNENKINIIDTPGAADFVGEVVTSFRVAESAVMLIGARSGVQIETIKLWRRLNKREMPRIAFINKMDKDRADYQAVFDEMKERFKKTFVPVVIPIGAGADYKGVIDLITMKAYMIPKEGDKEVAVDIPADMADIVEDYHFKLVEWAAEGDDELTEKYFDEGTLGIEDVKKGLQEGIVANKLVPVCCGSTLQNSGVAPLLDLINVASPSPLGIHETMTDEEGNETDMIINTEEKFSGMSFKTTIDKFAGKLSFIKVMTGILTPSTDLYNQREGKKDKFSKIYIPEGKDLVEVDELRAGDLGVVAKLGTAHTNDTFCVPDRIVHYKPLQLPQPVFSVAINAGTKKEEDKLSEQLLKATEEDKTFSMQYNKETRETVVSSMGELHLNIVLERIKEATKIEVETRTPKVAYRETIQGSSDAEYTHKKQSGGHGQYARVALKIKPLERGGIFKFVNDIHGGSISKGYLPGVEKGMQEGMEEGPLAGYPVVDIEATVYDGKEHPVDSSEMAFKLASRGATKEAIEKAKPVLLEPVMKLAVFCEESNMGDVLSDLSSRRGRVLGQENLGGGITEIDALVPQSELLRYVIDLKALTSGTASFEMEFDHYDPVSGRIADKIIADSKELVESK